MQIEILNPKAARLLKDLEEMELISIKKPGKINLSSLLEQLRSNDKSTLSSEDIIKEVEFVRSRRHGKGQ